jgi:hypothetical protein
MDRKFSMEIRIPLNDKNEIHCSDAVRALEGMKGSNWNTMKVEIKEGFLIFSQSTL